MEKLKVKHDHKLTDILKVAIFAIFLLLPFLTYAPNGFYYGFNEHAVAQEKTVQEPNYYETNEINEANDIYVDHIYFWKDNYTIDQTERNKTYFTIKFTNEIANLLNVSQDLTNTTVKMETGNSSMIVYLYINNEPNTYTIVNEMQFNFVVLSLGNPLTQNILNSITESNQKLIKDYTEQTYTQSISDSMNNNWQLMWQTPMYSWTNNSILKTGLDNFTSVFGVNNDSYITNLITYELIIITIYIVIDIVLTLFKWLTHMVGSKE